MVLFFLLAIGQYVPPVIKVAGFEGVFCGFSAMYTAMAEVTNEIYGETKLPIIPAK